MHIYDERCERPNFARCKSPLLIAHAFFLSRMTNIAVKTLVVSCQTCIFVEHHITKERLKPREQTVAVAHAESITLLETTKAPIVCRDLEKKRTQHLPSPQFALSIHRLFSFFRT